ncbi:glycosyhydrolase [Lacibacter luteus]|uniref:Glycosyhydrolase n=1 Tax=Lacibacter luteus TaxID=2508719 RepID=A0A4Q1CL81_9BACT|nr:glycosyl hydrolase 115 family protein [Lacibacter luteus]RXK61743.1 glycosyhydrolase [Lacibacter luteus]
MKKTILLVAFCLLYLTYGNAQLLATGAGSSSYSISGATILVDNNDHAVVQKAAHFFSTDMQSVTLKQSSVINSLSSFGKTVIIIGSADKSTFIKQLVQQKKLSIASLKGKWEAYTIQTIKNPFKGIEQALVIAGSDRRGTAFGVFEVSKQIGVSPWHWWADVPVQQKQDVFISANEKITDAPKVKYRGIFINDEAPALSNWSKEKFGGFNSKFYAKVFELMLRLKSNYIWPAMWGNAFYDDDSLNIKVADEYAIVIGTSHHEPLMRAHAEWAKYGKKQKWNYDSTEAGLQEFWRGGMQRAWNEKIVSVGMRGDGDEPMSRETATALLERIVKDQRKIITNVTGKPAEQTPQLWALYKEVQDYYDKGMRVPDDVTLLLCDDNWGNIRKLPKPNEKPRKGGYGIYYHFDYVGGPRNYKWLNTNPLPRIWEQMHLAYEHHVKDIWIVNVGDIKPMELPISFFLDYAWDPAKIDATDVQTYTVNWAAQQFGTKHATTIAELLAKYAKYNSRRKPEMLDDKTYSFFYGEWEQVVNEYNDLLNLAETINNALSPEQKDAFFQLVLHPIKACANLNELYYNVALNKEAFKEKYETTNGYADKVKELYKKDSLITVEYHQLNKGKWNHMMSQTHIGYTYWQQPPFNRMPAVQYLPDSTTYKDEVTLIGRVPQAEYPATIKHNAFVERFETVSIEAAHYTNANNSKTINWKVLPDLGRTGSAVTTFPVTAAEQQSSAATPFLEYEIYTYSKDSFTIHAYFSPTLNFFNEENGLQYAISVDDEAPQIISINKEDKNSISGIWNKWVGENIIIKTSRHKLSSPGKHVIKYWMVNSGVLLQKIVADFGGMKRTYLGPPETRINN